MNPAKQLHILGMNLRPLPSRRRLLSDDVTATMIVGSMRGYDVFLVSVYINTAIFSNLSCKLYFN